MNRTNLIIASLAIFAIEFFALSFGLGLATICLHSNGLDIVSEAYDPDNILMGLYIIVLVLVCMLVVILFILFIFNKYEESAQISLEWFLLRICSVIFFICTIFLVALLAEYLKLMPDSKKQITALSIILSFSLLESGASIFAVRKLKTM